MENWNKQDEVISNDEYRYKSSKEAYNKVENNVKIQITVDKDRKFCLMYKSFEGIDEIVFLGESVFDEEIINEKVSPHFSTSPLTLEDLKNKYDSLVYFTKDLFPVSQDVLYESFRNEKLCIDVSSEMLFVNKVNTISRMYDWEETNKDREFHKLFFRRKITSPSSEVDAFGSIKGFGMHFPSQYEFNLYIEFHNKYFSIQDEKDSVLN